MDVTFANATDIPEKAIVSVRVGEQRRQASYKENCKFNFDSSQSHNKRVVVDIFERVSTKTVWLADLAGEGPELTDRIHLPRKDNAASPVSLDMKVVVHGPATEAGKRPSSATRRHQSTIKANEYLREFGVQSLLTSMMQAVLLQQPVDPVDFMIGFMTDRQRQQARPSSAPGSKPSAPLRPQQSFKDPPTTPSKREKPAQAWILPSSDDPDPQSKSTPEVSSMHDAKLLPPAEIAEPPDVKDDSVAVLPMSRQMQSASTAAEDIEPVSRDAEVAVLSTSHQIQSASTVAEEIEPVSRDAEVAVLSTSHQIQSASTAAEEIEPVSRDAEVQALRASIQNVLSDAMQSGNMLKCLRHVVLGETLEPLAPTPKHVQPPCSAPPTLAPNS